MVLSEADTRIAFPIQGLYVETNMIENGGRKSQKKILINQGEWQGCPLSTVLFNLYLDHVIIELQDNNLLQTSILTTLLSDDNQVIMTASEDSVQELLHQLSKTASMYNLFLQLKQKYEP
jgi:hypothetical protein